MIGTPSLYWNMKSKSKLGESAVCAALISTQGDIKTTLAGRGIFSLESRMCMSVRRTRLPPAESPARATLVAGTP